MKHCSVMFCAPRWICALAAPAVPRWPREGRKHRVPVVQPSTVLMAISVPGVAGDEENSTANDPTARGRSCTYNITYLVYLGRFLGGRRWAGRLLLQERAPSSRMAAGMSCIPRKGTCCTWTQGRHVQTTRRRRRDECVECVAPFRTSWT